MELNSQRRIVVGVDGSEGARDAIDWAVREADHGRHLVVLVNAWNYPATAGSAWTMAYPEAFGGLESNAAALLSDAVAYAGAVDSTTRTETILAQGDPARALVEAAKGADLLVVGSRGRGGFIGLLLGSVSQQCAHHTPCPLVIVPTGWSDQARSVSGDDVDQPRE